MKLQKDCIKLNKKFENKEEAIRYCGQLLVKGGYVNETYINEMLKRDKNLSVYMGNFIAIPHGTKEAKSEVLKTGMTIVQVPEGVNFGNEKEPKIVTILFGIASSGNEHLDLIQKISLFCADVNNVAKLADAQDVEQIIEYFDFEN